MCRFGDDFMTACMYIDKDGYEDQHLQRYGIYEDVENHVYERTPISYVTKQYIVADVVKV